MLVLGFEIVQALKENEKVTLSHCLSRPPNSEPNVLNANKPLALRAGSSGCKWNGKSAANRSYAPWEVIAFPRSMIGTGVC